MATTKTKKSEFANEVMRAAKRGDGTGFCIKCFAEHDGVEPDACKYPCEVCGKDAVYGAEEILMMFF